MSADVATRQTAEPTITSSSPDDWTNGMNKAGRDVAWYQKSLNTVPKIALEIFREYSGIPDDKVMEHIYKVRDKAWDILPYPCIGLFRFLDFPAYLQPIYPEVLQRVRAGETFLDLGCCFGQDIRKLVHDGAPSANIIGVDSEARFLELGHELFRDRDTLDAHFAAGDVFAPDFLADFRGKIDIIFLGSFLHLFSYEQQEVIIVQLTKLLRKKPGSLVFGRHMATTGRGGLLSANACGWSLYHHSTETIRTVFETAPGEFKWDVSSELVPYASESWDNGSKWQGSDGSDEIKQQRFVARLI